MSGYSEQELLTMSIPDIEAIENPEATAARIQKIKERGYAYFESKHRRKDGTIFDVEVSSRFLPFNGGECVTFVRDITERKQAEDKLRESEEKFRNIFDHSYVGKSITTMDGKLMTNEAFCRIVGYSKDELNNIKWQELTHPDDIAESSEIINAITSGEKESAIWEKRYIHKDGHIVWVDINTTLQRDSSGAPLYFITAVNDITDRKRIETALIKSEAQSRDNLILLQSVINHFPGVVFWKDTKSIYLGCNKNFSDAAGLTNPDEIIGKSDFDLPWAGVEATDYREFDRLVMESGEARLHIIETQHQADEKITWFDTCKVPIFDKDGTVIGILGASFDITEIKRSEEERLQLQQQFQQTQKLESLGVLSGGIAHDFNNILAIIMGYCNLTKMDYESAEKNIQEIEKAAERAAGLCRQMLAYAGKSQLTMTQVNMWMLTDEMVTMLKATLPKNAVIKPELSTNIPLITADASQLRQVVMNLIINASEAINKEQGEILISLSETNVIAGHQEMDHQGKDIPTGKYVCLEVTDTGCGMDEETKWRIFEPFYTTKFTGRGLGMSAVLGIISSHGGFLQLFSQIGHGTTFKVYLPILKHDSTGEDEQNPSVPATPWKGSGTILLVEDEEQIRYVAKAMLEMFGFTVLEAVNGKEGLELYQRNTAEIRLVFTDMGMPVMDGYALLPALKQLNPKLPIIISSGFGDSDVTSRIGSDNIAGIISKPYNLNQLREVLKGVVEETTSTHA